MASSFLRQWEGYYQLKKNQFSYTNQLCELNVASVLGELVSPVPTQAEKLPGSHWSRQGPPEQSQK